MTIALGILANDGVVIAADTQESFGLGYEKTHSYKIFSRVVEGEGRAISLTGAGGSGYLDALIQDLAEDFIDTPDPKKAERRLRTTCATFYREHIKSMDVPDDLHPRIVAGLHWKDGPSFLMTNSGSAMHRRKRPMAVGIGEPQAAILLNQLLPEHKKDTTVDIAARVAAYTICRVKNSTEGCGLGTHVTVLVNGYGKHFARDTINALERCFDTYQALENSVFAYVIGRPIDNIEAVPGLLTQSIGEARVSIQAAVTTIPLAASRPLKFSDERPGPTEQDGYISLFGDAIVKRSRVQPVRQGSKRGLKARPPSRA